jgi:hypothetical protein
MQLRLALLVDYKSISRVVSDDWRDANGIINVNQ